MKKLMYVIISILLILPCCNIEKANSEIIYTMPEESSPHEGTWLQWVHQHQYGIAYRNRLDPTWLKMTKELVSSERVHIIAYDDIEKNRIISLLNSENVPLTNIDFKIYPTDDVWVRDNGPIYVTDKNKKLLIEDWGFNGWGKKADFLNCNAIPAKISDDQNIKKINLNDVMTIEGGSVEIDGNGTLLATKSSILNKNRNLGMTQVNAEKILTKYLGVTNFIWLDGVAGLEITDMHIDGFARFGNATTIVTMAQNDLLEWQVKQKDIDTLYDSKNKESISYSFLKLPLTENNVVTTYGTDLGYRGSYVNYYIANTKVLVPNYNDPNDKFANDLIQSIYPTRKVIGIDVRNLYANGGMIHCVTQQQPK